MPCKDIDESTLNDSMCKKNGVFRPGVKGIVNVPGSYYCICDTGFTWEEKNRRCYKVPPCEFGGDNDCDLWPRGSCTADYSINPYDYKCACNYPFTGTGKKGTCCSMIEFYSNFINSIP